MHQHEDAAIVLSKGHGFLPDSVAGKTDNQPDENDCSAQRQESGRDDKNRVRQKTATETVCSDRHQNECIPPDMFRSAMSV